MTTTRMNYRVHAGPESDPVRSQARSVVRLVKLFKQHAPPPAADAQQQQQQQQSFTADAKGTVDKAFFAKIFTAVMATPEGRAELQAVLAENQERVATMLRAERVEVRDARLATAAGQVGLGLRSSGFALEPHRSRVVDWGDAQCVADVYYREIEAVVKRVTGATRTFCNGHLVRRSGDSDGPLGKLFTAIAGPIRFVYVRARVVAEPDAAPSLPARRARLVPRHRGLATEGVQHGRHQARTPALPHDPGAGCLVSGRLLPC